MSWSEEREVRGERAERRVGDVGAVVAGVADIGVASGRRHKILWLGFGSSPEKSRTFALQAAPAFAMLHVFE